jgi:hypothetical protein
VKGALAITKINVHLGAVPNRESINKPTSKAAPAINIVRQPADKETSALRFMLFTAEDFNSGFCLSIFTPQF